MGRLRNYLLLVFNHVHNTRTIQKETNLLIIPEYEDTNLGSIGFAACIDETPGDSPHVS